MERDASSIPSPYITADGYHRLQAESKELWKRRTIVTKALAAAAAEGDRSENAEYIYRKKELREIDRRIRYLQKRLPQLKVVSKPPTDKKSVFFGAWVSLTDGDGKDHTYRLVGSDEFDASKGWISMDSPMARALLKKKAGDEAMVTSPLGTFEYRVVKVQYEPIKID